MKQKNNVKIVDEESNALITTYMCHIPRRGDKVGFWLDGYWSIFEVEYTVFEFNENANDKFEIAEVNIIMNII